MHTLRAVVLMFLGADETVPCGRPAAVVHGREVSVGGGASVAEHPVDGGDAGDGEGVAHPLGEQRFANFPSEEAGVLLFEAQDPLDDRRCGHLL